MRNAYPISKNEAKDLAGLLREAGYQGVSQKRCNDFACNVVRYYAGSDPDAQREVEGLINEACGLEQEVL